MLVGIGIGAIAAIAGEIIGFTDLGHKINDPVLMALSISTLLRSLIYFNFWALIRPIIFALVIGIVSGATLRFIATQLDRRMRPSNGGTAASVAVITSLIPILIQEISGLQVLLWYGVSSWFSVLIASAVAARAAR
ncbi:MAG: hypothetical protein DWQ07_02380 [Chloroflexi bacterium]|nr:MAG: hypothetical protein DWQ07_02380 [Chloroflexota bacterium]MBL1193654.1 hypothetical protein [Chloroflexota bacterium]